MKFIFVETSDDSQHLSCHKSLRKEQNCTTLVIMKQQILKKNGSWGFHRPTSLLRLLSLDRQAIMDIYDRNVNAKLSHLTCFFQKQNASKHLHDNLANWVTTSRVDVFPSGSGLVWQPWWCCLEGPSSSPYFTHFTPLFRWMVFRNITLLWKSK